MKHLMKKLGGSSLHLRILSAVTLGPIFVLSLFWGGPVFKLCLLAALCLSIYEWYSITKKTEAFFFYFPLGLLYMFLAFACFYGLRVIYSVNVALLFLGMVWISDIGAYFTGKLYGGPKLIEKISPNKTWSGFVGALIFPAIFGLIWAVFAGLHGKFNTLDNITLPLVGFAFGLSVGAAGQAGDLLISFVKRKAKVKDTGNVIPGHGGLLDRTDSMMLASIVFYLIIKLGADAF